MHFHCKCTLTSSTKTVFLLADTFHSLNQLVTSCIILILSKLWPYFVNLDIHYVIFSYCILSSFQYLPVTRFILDVKHLINEVIEKCMFLPTCREFHKAKHKKIKYCRRLLHYKNFCCMCHKVSLCVVWSQEHTFIWIITNLSGRESTWSATEPALTQRIHSKTKITEQKKINSYWLWQLLVCLSWS